MKLGLALGRNGGGGGDDKGGGGIWWFSSKSNKSSCIIINVSEFRLLFLTQSTLQLTCDEICTLTYIIVGIKYIITLLHKCCCFGQYFGQLFFVLSAALI